MQRTVTNARIQIYADYWFRTDGIEDGLLAHEIDILVDLAGYTEGNPP